MSDWQDAEQRVERAQEFFAQRLWQEALDELCAAIAMNPYNGAWHFNAGLTLDELERFEDAIAAYRRALEMEPDDVEAMHRIGADLARLGRYREALDELEAIEQVDASFEPAYCDRILVYGELGEHDRAEETFYLARQYREECPRCYYHMGMSLAARRLFDKAIYCWQRVVDLDDGYPEVHLKLARAHWERGNLEKSRQAFLKELRLNPGNIWALLELGDLLMEMGHSDEAGEKLRRAIELCPDEASTHLRYGRWLLSRRRVEAAREAFAQALRLDHGCPGIRMALAEACLREKDLGGARVHLRAELRGNPDHPRLLLDLSNLLMDTGMVRAAAACLRRLVVMDPGDPVAWQNLAVAQFTLRRYDDGVESSLQALLLAPKMPSAMYNLALAFERQGDYRRAMTWIKRARTLDAHDPTIQRLELRIGLLMGWQWLWGKIRGLLAR